MPLAEAGERWDASAEGEGAGRQHKGQSEAAGRARLRSQRDGGSDTKGDARLHPSIHHAVSPPTARAASAAGGDTCG